MTYYKRIADLSPKRRPGRGGYGCSCCNPYGKRNVKREINRALRRIQRVKDRVQWK